MENPFVNTIEYTAIERAFLSMIQDRTLKILYRNISHEREAAYCFPPVNAILMPKIDKSALTKRQQRLYTANFYHETRHYFLSDVKEVNRATAVGQLVKDLANSIEDARIENCTIAALEGGKQDLTEDNIEACKQYNEKSSDQEKNRWGWLGQAIFFHLTPYGTLNISEENQKYFDIAVEILNDGRFQSSCLLGKEGNKTSVDLAIDIAKAWQNQKDEEKEDGQGEPDNEGNSNGESGDSPAGETRDNSAGKSDSGNGDGSKSDEMDRDNPSDSKSDDGEKGRDQCGDGGDNDGGSVEDNATPNKRRGGRKDSKPKEEENPSQNSSEPSGSDSIEEEYKSAEKITKSRAKQVAEMGKEGDSKDFKGEWWHNASPNSKGDPYLAYTAQDREVIAKSYEASFQEIQSSIKSKVTYLQGQLSMILRSVSKTKKEKFLKHGVLDPSRYYAAIKGSKFVKTQTTYGIKLNTAVSLLIDLSGSMFGERAKLAAQIATLFGESLLEVPNTTYEIRGYNSSPASGTRLAGDCQRTETINHWVFKKFSENWRTVRSRMGACSHSMNVDEPANNGAVGGCNCDHENLIYAAHHLFKRKEENKILIVLCDGQPSGYNGTYNGRLVKELKKAIKTIKQSKIHLFCFGIQSKEVEEFYAPDVEIVQDLNSFDEKALKKLAEMILKGNMRKMKNSS